MLKIWHQSLNCRSRTAVRLTWTCAVFICDKKLTLNWALLRDTGMSWQCLIYLYLQCFKVSLTAISALLKWEKRELSSKQLFQHKTVAFPCRWLIQVRWGRRGGIRLWALSVNHTALPHRRHLSPNTKGFGPWGTLKPISSLTCNPSRSTKSSIVECYHIHFLCKRGCSKEKVRGREQGGKKGFEETLGYVLGTFVVYFFCTSSNVRCVPFVSWCGLQASSYDLDIQT